jgi:hypothetical protein
MPDAAVLLHKCNDVLTLLTFDASCHLYELCQLLTVLQIKQLVPMQKSRDAVCLDLFLLT